MRLNNKRNLNVEALRVVAMLSILMLHFSSILFSSKTGLIGSIESIVRSYFFIGVSTFAFISSYYGVKWNAMKFFKYEFMAVSLGGVIFIFDIVASGSFHLRSLFLLFPILSEVCWYYSAYILLMIVSPFLNDKLKTIDLKLFGFLLTIMMIICYGGNFIFHRNGTTFGLLFFIYFLGQYIRRRKIEISSGMAILIFFGSTSLMALATFMATNILDGELMKIICNNHNPLIIISAISLFFTFKNMKRNYIMCKGMAYIAPYTFAVYIIHVELLYLDLIPVDLFKFSNDFINTLIISLLVFSGCVLVEYVRIRLFGNWEEQIIKKVINKIGL